MRPLYFDYNATTPVLPRVMAAMEPYFQERFGNPSSDHFWGQQAKKGMERARGQVAALLNCTEEEVFFTGGATEAINMVLLGLLARGEHLLTSAIEHPATLQTAAALERQGVAVTLAPVDRAGIVDPGELARLARPDTKLISLMLANNETGAIQPVAQVAAWARERGIWLHCDAAQAVGKIAVDTRELGVDFLTLAGHKLYAPKGVGALYVRSGVSLPPLMFGGGQERGLRPGTENVPYLVALGEACALAAEDPAIEEARQRSLGEIIESGLKDIGFDYRVHCPNGPRLPNTLAVGFKGLRSGDILSGLVGAEVALSAGAACHGDVEEISHVLTAMGCPLPYARSTVRISWGRPTSEEDARELLDRLGRVLKSLS